MPLLIHEIFFKLNSLANCEIKFFLKSRAVPWARRVMIPSDLISSDALLDCYFVSFLVVLALRRKFEVTVDDLHSTAISGFQRFFVNL